MKFGLFMCFLSVQVTLFSQTCCSGGVPLSGNLGMPTAESGALQISLSYDINILKTVKSGREVINDQRRIRKTHSTLFEVGYNWSDRISTDGFFSFIRQERIINDTDVTSTQGIGDAVILLKYKVISLNNEATTLHLAAGPKIPLGSSDKTLNGISLNADLQPGSGAWDGVFLGQFTHILSIRPSMSLVSIIAYNLKGKNNAYLGTNTYQFGNEFQLSLGISDRILIGKTLVDPSLTSRFRSVKVDKFNQNALPSTGGNWVFLIPGTILWFNPNFSIQINAEIPFYSNVQGTQLSPDFRFNLGLYYKHSPK